METRTHEELWESAAAEAAKIAPPPRIEPLTAGMVGAVIMFFALDVFWLLADLPRHPYVVAAAVTCALGFGVPFLIVRWADHRNYVETKKAYVQLLELKRSAVLREQTPGRCAKV